MVAKPLVLPRLLYKVARAAAHGFDRQIHAAPSRHHDDRKHGVHRLDLRQQLKPFLAGGGVARVVQVDEGSVIIAVLDGTAKPVAAIRRLSIL